MSVPAESAARVGRVPHDRLRRADVCCVAIAEVFRGDGEIVANPIGTIPRIGGLLARLSFEPDLVMTDGEAMFENADGVVEAWNPYQSMFDVVWSGRRHVIMGGSQLDALGNHNFAAIGDMKHPKAQLLGFRGAPGNTVNNVTSYWVPNHNPRVFVESVDVVTGVGYDRAEAAGSAATARSWPTRSARFRASAVCLPGCRSSPTSS